VALDEIQQAVRNLKFLGDDVKLQLVGDVFAGVPRPSRNLRAIKD
jgi:hypothetical protein